MESTKSPETREVLNKLLVIIDQGFKEYSWMQKGEKVSIRYNFEIADHEQPIILTDSENIPFLSAYMNRPFPDEPAEANECRKRLGDYRIKQIDNNKAPLKNAVEITTPEGMTLFLMPKSEYEKIKKTGIHDKNEKVKQLIDKFFSMQGKKGNPEKEHLAAKAITGEMGFIVPILAGIKPAGVMKNDEELEKILEITGLSIIPYSDTVAEKHGLDRPNESIIFNPVAVQKMVADNPDIFSTAGIDKKMSADEIIKKSLGLTDSLSDSEQKPEITKVVGLLLGFDKTSVLNFGKNKNDEEKSSFEDFNIWNVEYIAKEGPDLEKMKTAYKDLQADITDLLSAGLSPAEILKQIPLLKQRRNTKIKILDNLEPIA